MNNRENVGNQVDWLKKVVQVFWTKRILDYFYI